MYIDTVAVYCNSIISVSLSLLCIHVYVSVFNLTVEEFVAFIKSFLSGERFPVLSFFGCCSFTCMLVTSVHPDLIKAYHPYYIWCNLSLCMRKPTISVFDQV